jgi:hypothetical protein
MSAHVYQIFYDDSSRESLDPGFLPLDNTRNARSGWFEFWPIREYLHKNTLDEQDWYGFLSPRFRAKTGVDPATLGRFLEFSEQRAEVALITAAWDQLAYFQNPFEQGDLWHPGLGALCQSVADALGLDIDLRSTVAHSGNFAYCNYLIAKPVYWRRWLALADQLFALAEEGAEPHRSRLAALTNHYSRPNATPMKAFVQERLPLLLMLRHRFRTTTLDVSAAGAIDPLFPAQPRTRALLQTCDQLKRTFTETHQAACIEAYRTVRALVPVQLPAVAPVRAAAELASAAATSG